MKNTSLKLATVITLLTASTFSQASRDPSEVYSSELQSVKLQYPGSSDEVCESGTSTPCIGFREYGLWWMYDSNNSVVHKINGDDPDRNELRNQTEFNMISSSKTFSGTVAKIAASSFNHVTVLQLHRSVDGSKPVMRIAYDLSNDQYEYTVAYDEGAADGYCKGSFSTSGSGSKAYSISQSGSTSDREIKMTFGGETIYCDISAWPSESTYYYKMGTYLSDGDGSAEFKFINWNWNQ